MPATARAILLAVVIGAGVVWVLSSGDRPPPPIAPGEPAPGFALPRLGPEGSEGQGGAAPVSLDELRGQVVLVNFWATWCKPCEDEMPAMERLYQQLAPRGFELLAVSVDSGSEEVLAFQQRLGLSFPILHDPAKRVSELYQSYRFPESYLVDRDGTLVERYIGPRDWDDPAYVGRIERLLGP